MQGLKWHSDHKKMALSHRGPRKDPLLVFGVTLPPQDITGQRGNTAFDRSLLEAVLYLLRHEKFGMVTAP